MNLEKINTNTEQVVTPGSLVLEFFFFCFFFKEPNILLRVGDQNKQRYLVHRQTPQTRSLTGRLELRLQFCRSAQNRAILKINNGYK